MKKTNQFSIFIVFLLIVSCGSEEQKSEKSIKIEKVVGISSPEKENKTKIQENNTINDTVLFSQKN